MEQFKTCDECGRTCYTGGVAYPDEYICVDCEDEELQLEIERMEQKSKEFSKANLSVVKLRLEKKITKQEGKDMLKEKFPDMVSDDEDVDRRDAPNIYHYYKCSECGCEMDEEDYWEGECESVGQCENGECRVCVGRGICDGCWNAKH